MRWWVNWYKVVMLRGWLSTLRKFLGVTPACTSLRTSHRHGLNKTARGSPLIFRIQPCTLYTCVIYYPRPHVREKGQGMGFAGARVEENEFFRAALSGSPLKLMHQTKRGCSLFPHQPTHFPSFYSNYQFRH